MPPVEVVKTGNGVQTNGDMDESEDKTNENSPQHITHSESVRSFILNPTYV